MGLRHFLLINKILMNQLKEKLGLVILGFISFVHFNISAQSNTTELENWCGTAKRMNDMWADPQQSQILLEDEQIRLNESNHPVNAPKATIYNVPVVFHILHNGGPENISEAQIFNALEVINRDFRKQNADTAEVVSMFKPIIGDVEVEFLLATNAPDGSCFRGFTRTRSPLTFEGDDGGGQVNAVRNGNDVYQGNWPSNKYLNVYVIADAGGAGGYTNYPSNWNLGDMSNGIWILHTQFGEIGTSGLSAGRSLTHEIGHWLNLPHTWGSSNTPGLASNCNTDDGVNDTPLTIGVPGGCPLTQDDCGPIANVQNYMDYALSCQSMFTNGQVSRMRTAIESGIGGRNNLWKASNLSATGAGEMTLCKADFSANKTVICAGDVIQFNDLTYNSVNGWTWSFDGGIPTNSTEQNPSVTYSQPGVYEVELMATDGFSSNTESRLAYITVLNAASSLPFHESFENYTSLNGINEWIVENPGNDAKWEITTDAAFTGSKSVKLANFGQTSNDIDELFAASVDLSGVSETNTTLSFRYAYRKRNTTDYEKLSVHFSGNCGATWSQKKTIPGSLLGNIITTTSWTPESASDWVTIHITNFNASFMTSDFRYKFMFQSDGGNNLYLDDINIYEGDPSDVIVVGLEELTDVKNVSLYPNPSAGEVNLNFSTSLNQSVEVGIFDLAGNEIQRKVIQAKTGQNLVMLNTDNCAKGMYFVKLKTGSSQQMLQFVKK